jgi:YggT family protein
VGIVAVLAWVVFAALGIFILLMWVRLILDWVRALQPRWRPTGALLVFAELCFAVTDPPLKLVRRVVKPIRIGGAQLDFAWSIVLIACLVLLYVIGPLRFVT